LGKRKGFGKCEEGSSRIQGESECRSQKVRKDR